MLHVCLNLGNCACERLAAPVRGLAWEAKPRTPTAMTDSPANSQAGRWETHGCKTQTGLTMRGSCGRSAIAWIIKSTSKNKKVWVLRSVCETTHLHQSSFCSFNTVIWSVLFYLECWASVSQVFWCVIMSPVEMATATALYQTDRLFFQGSAVMVHWAFLVTPCSACHAL